MQKTIGPTRWASSRRATVGPRSSAAASSPGSSTASKNPLRASAPGLEPGRHIGRRHQTERVPRAPPRASISAW